MLHKESQYEKGFTLTEMSIVVVIVAFVVTAFMYGKDLIGQTKTLSVIRDYNNYKSAIDNFKFKYNAVPGDFADAKSYWGSCLDVGGNLCNGDGDGKIVVAANENGRAWQHLTLSKLVDEKYEGGIINSSSIAGVHYPKSEVKAAGYDLLNKSNDEENFKVALTLGKTGSTGVNQSSLLAIDAWGIDHKIDDGIALSGHVFVSVSSDDASGSTGCMDSATPAQYNQDDGINKCLIHFAIK